ncbi:MAG: septation protein SepH, partial [Gordonia sp. (in: high G+C Gram-positive bacteria)]
DAWRSESGQWMVQVRPDPAAEATARWRFTPGSHGGITEPMDDLAVELTEPELARTVRRPVVAPVPVERDPEPEPAPRPSPPSREIDAEGHEFVTVDADDLTEQQQQRRRGPQFDEVLDLRYDDETRVEAPTPREENESTTPRHRGKRATPTVPAWEDVLLGVRSHPND